MPRGQLPQNVLSRAPDATGGLYVKGYISPTTIGNDALTLMRDTVLDELSIGYDSIKDDTEEGKDGEGMIRYLREIKLMDVSPVPLAMNAAAMITSVKKWLDTIDVPGEREAEEAVALETERIEEEVLGAELDGQAKEAQGALIGGLIQRARMQRQQIEEL